jgi:hypothetical protein
MLGGVPELCIVKKTLKQALASQLLSHSTKKKTHTHTHTHKQQRHRKSRIIESYGKTKLAPWFLHRQIIIHKEKEELHHETPPQPENLQQKQKTEQLQIPLTLSLSL